MRAHHQEAHRSSSTTTEAVPSELMSRLADTEQAHKNGMIGGAQAATAKKRHCDCLGERGGGGGGAGRRKNWTVSESVPTIRSNGPSCEKYVASTLQHDMRSKV